MPWDSVAAVVADDPALGLGHSWKAHHRTTQLRLEEPWMADAAAAADGAVVEADSY